MTKPSGQSDPGVNRVDELGRIYITALLACVLIALSVLLDGPVSILSWLLLISGFLCLTYVVVATRTLLIYFRSLDQNTESHE